MAVAIDATVCTGFGVNELEDVFNLLFGRNDTSGVFTFENVNESFRESNFMFFNNFAVTDGCDGYAGIEISEDIKVENYAFVVYFDYIFFAHFNARDVFEKSYGAVERIETEGGIEFMTLTCFDMVDNDTVFD